MTNANMNFEKRSNPVCLQFFLFIIKQQLTSQSFFYLVNNHCIDLELTFHCWIWNTFWSPQLNNVTSMQTLFHPELFGETFPLPWRIFHSETIFLLHQNFQIFLLKNPFFPSKCYRLSLELSRRSGGSLEPGLV